MEHLKSRKFIVAMFTLISSSVLCWFTKIEPGVYSVVVIATITAYMTANVSQKKITDIK